MVDFIGKKISTDVDAAIAQLISAEHFIAGSLVSMPVMYPSGASVVLEITSQKDRFFISDRGGGFQEAEYMGAGRTYAREAERIAHDSGIRFDGRDMFIMEVAIEAISSALIVVANCSQQAASISAMRAAERVYRDAKEILITRLEHVYRKETIIKDAKIIGASNHNWPVAALVRTEGRPVVFDAVSAHYNSVVSTAAKFHDLARLEGTPKRIAVVPNRKMFGDYLGVLSAASTSVIEVNASNETYQGLLAA
ncbi:MAG: hypothetical protein BGN84_15745 [Afipia sp. 62-7]|nr:hypothetical protein [Afipia sp.]OJU21482.1 MAG: hypothetical protein BGN84_15745 [Afipia sp. 62-7]